MKKSIKTKTIACGILLAALMAAPNAFAMGQAGKAVPKAAPSGMFKISEMKADVTGDKVQDTITLFGKREKATDIYNEELLINIANPINKQTINIPIKDGGYNPTLTLHDFTGDHVADLFIGADTGGSGGFSTYHMYQINNKKPVEIKLPGIGNKGEEGLFGLMFNQLKPIDLNQDGTYELQGIERMTGESNADVRMYISTFWKYDKSKWNLVKAGGFIPETLDLFGKWKNQQTGKAMEFTTNGQLLKAGEKASTYYFQDSNHVMVVSEGHLKVIGFELQKNKLVWDTENGHEQTFLK
ncbi:hypothetical protein ACQCN2_15065 [Brevibacillus ginsengisoli]|uniref:hypothetical protein n=1 Tax=Brevibacillus ginsengisoli TaxID=363854 RepID=UPI003CF029C6